MLSLFIARLKQLSTSPTIHNVNEKKSPGDMPLKRKEGVRKDYEGKKRGIKHECGVYSLILSYRTRLRE